MLSSISDIQNDVMITRPLLVNKSHLDLESLSAPNLSKGRHIVTVHKRGDNFSTQKQSKPEDFLHEGCKIPRLFEFDKNFWSQTYCTKTTDSQSCQKEV